MAVRWSGHSKEELTHISSHWELRVLLNFPVSGNSSLKLYYCATGWLLGFHVLDTPTIRLSHSGSDTLGLLVSSFSFHSLACSLFFLYLWIGSKMLTLLNDKHGSHLQNATLTWTSDCQAHHVWNSCLDSPESYIPVATNQSTTKTGVPASRHYYHRCPWLPTYQNATCVIILAGLPNAPAY